MKGIVSGVPPACEEELQKEGMRASCSGSEVLPSPGQGPAVADGCSCVPVTAQSGGASHRMTSCPPWRGACTLMGVRWALGISIVRHHLVGVQSS